MKCGYTIEIVNWEWMEIMSRKELCYWATHDLPCIKSFRTQRDAREWLGRMGFVPVFDVKRPCLYRSRKDRYGKSGMQAEIRRVPRSRAEGFLRGSGEWQVQRRLCTAAR